MSSPGPVVSPRRDPARRDRIIDATLAVIAREGVQGTSIRRVAAEAGVPLGSMTYHFEGRDQLLLEAFERFVEASVVDIETKFEGVTTLEGAREGVVRILTEGAYMEYHNIVIGAELYALAAHDPQFVAVQREWMHRSRAAIRQFFDAETTLMLDAMVEGMSMHRSFEENIHPKELVRAVIERMTPPETFIA